MRARKRHHTNKPAHQHTSTNLSGHPGDPFSVGVDHCGETHTAEREEDRDDDLPQRPVPRAVSSMITSAGAGGRRRRAGKALKRVVDAEDPGGQDIDAATTDSPLSTTKKKRTLQQVIEALTKAKVESSGSSDLVALKAGSPHLQPEKEQ